MADFVQQLNASLKDRYDVERELGRGGMATVFLARDVIRDRPVAIKVIHNDIGAAMGVERFRREIEIASNLSHPNILELFESGEVNGRLFYVMPYIAGESLRERMMRQQMLPLDDALVIITQVARALDFAHQRQIVHRDVKPENILLRDRHAIVADFGIARAVDSVNKGAPLTQTGVSLGTPTYMSPEQAFAEKDIDGRSDEYSLACVLFEMLVGEPPYTGPNAPAIMARHAMSAIPTMRVVRPDVPVDVDNAFKKALAKSPADRFSTAGEFADKLEEFISDRGRATLISAT